jgi:hypothetical protein
LLVGVSTTTSVLSRAKLKVHLLSLERCAADLWVLVGVSVDVTVRVAWRAVGNGTSTGLPATAANACCRLESAPRPPC